MPYDAHIHLDLYEPERLDALLKSAFAGPDAVDGLVAVSMDLASCRRNRELALMVSEGMPGTSSGYGAGLVSPAGLESAANANAERKSATRRERPPGLILPAYGHHPEQPPLDEAGLAHLCGWIRELGDEPFAIGEVGLPYYTRTEAEARGEAFDLRPYVVQLETFAALAVELDRPLVLHAVYEDADIAMNIMEKYGVKKAHFHWFKGSATTVTRLIRSGYFISITPDVLYEKEIRELSAVFPLDRLMAETDGPWPFEGPFAGRLTEPGMVRDVIREIADLRGLAEEEAALCLDGNTRQFYGWL